MWYRRLPCRYGISEMEVFLLAVIIIQGARSQELIRGNGGVYTCDEFIISERFYLKSPDYPANYPSNISCRYQIYRRSPDYCGILLNVLRFDVASTIVQSRDEIGNESKSIDEFTGSLDCPDDKLVIGQEILCGRHQRGETGIFLFYSHFLMVDFFSGPGSGASGFLLQGRQTRDCRSRHSLGDPLFSSVFCNRNFRSRRFNLLSPGFPNDYPNNTECSYRILKASPDICAVKLKIGNFTVEDGNCMFDYFEINRERMCGKLTPGETRSYDFENGEITIRFRTDESITRSGFNITGEQIPCSGETDIRLGRRIPSTVFGPNFSPPENLTLEEYLNIFRNRPLPLEGETSVDDGLIETIIGNGVLAGRNGGNSSAQNVPATPNFNPFVPGTRFPGNRPFPSNTGIPLPLPGASFRPSVSIPIPGSNLGPTALAPFPLPGIATFPTSQIPIRSCDLIFIEPQFTLQSPNYPNIYPDNVDCTYTIGRSSVEVCKLVFSVREFDVQGTVSNCATDYLDIEGTKYCGTFRDRILTIDFVTQAMQLRFHSDGAVGGLGFQIQVQQVSVSCGGPILPPIGPGQCDVSTEQRSFVLFSPGYPYRYPPGIDCTTTVIRAGPDIRSLQLNLADFEVENSAGCTKDYLEIAGERLCGHLTGQIRMYPFLGTTMILRFHTDIAIETRGYRILAHQVSSVMPPPFPGGPILPPPPGPGGPFACGGFITEPSFSLRSPHYPMPYPPNADCVWNVHKLSDDVCHLEMRIWDFNVEESPSCTKDFLQIGNQERLCGRRPRGEIRHYHFVFRTLTINFRSDEFSSNTGFHVFIVQKRCGELNPILPPSPGDPALPPTNYRKFIVIRPKKASTSDVWYKNFWKFNMFSKYHTSHPREVELHPIYRITHYKEPHPKYQPPSVHMSPPHYGYYRSLPNYPTTGPILPPVTPLPPTTSYPLQTTTTSYTLPPTPTPVLINSPFSVNRPGFPNIPFALSYEQEAEQLKSLSPNSITPSTFTDQREKIIGSSTCDRSIYSESFQISSPGHPGPSYANMDCVYKIIRKGRPYCAVKISLLDLDIPSAAHCKFGYLLLFGRKYCGSVESSFSDLIVPFPSDDEIILEFHGGEYMSGSGFLINGTQILCSFQRPLSTRLQNSAVEEDHDNLYGDLGLAGRSLFGDKLIRGKAFEPLSNGTQLLSNAIESRPIHTVKSENLSMKTSSVLSAPAYSVYFDPRHIETTSSAKLQLTKSAPTKPGYRMMSYDRPRNRQPVIRNEFVPSPSFGSVNGFKPIIL